MLRICGTSRRRRRLEARPLELLRYRSNLLGADLRITNFGGGNTSSKFDLADPLTGRAAARAGGEGQRRRPALDQERRGSPCSISTSSSSSSIAIAAKRTRTRWSASTRCARSARTASPRRSTRRSTRFCRSRTSITSTPTGRSRWRRARTARGRSRSSTRGTGAASSGCRGSGPGSSSALMLRRAVEANARMRRPHSRQPRAVHLGRHAARVLSQQHPHHRPDGRVHPRAPDAAGSRCSAARRSRAAVPDREAAAAAILPFLRGVGVVEPARHRPLRRLRGRADVRQLGVGGRALPDGHELPGSLPAHAHLADVRALGSGARGSRRSSSSASASASEQYRNDYAAYYASFADAASPALRDANPSVVVIPGTRAVRVREGQARGAHHVGVLRQRHPRDGGRQRARGRGRRRAARCRRPGVPSRRATSRASTTTWRCRGREAFRIEYWALEEAKLQRMPPEKEFSRKIASSSAAAAASAARSRCRLPRAARTSSSRT